MRDTDPHESSSSSTDRNPSNFAREQNKGRDALDCVTGDESLLTVDGVGDIFGDDVFSFFC